MKVLNLLYVKLHLKLKNNVFHHYMLTFKDEKTKFIVCKASTKLKNGGF